MGSLCSKCCDRGKNDEETKWERTPIQVAPCPALPARPTGIRTHAKQLQEAKKRLLHLQSFRSSHVVVSTASPRPRSESPHLDASPNANLSDNPLIGDQRRYPPPALVNLLSPTPRAPSSTSLPPVAFMNTEGTTRQCEPRIPVTPKSETLSLDGLPALDAFA